MSYSVVQVMHPRDGYMIRIDDRTSMEDLMAAAEMAGVKVGPHATHTEIRMEILKAVGSSYRYMSPPSVPYARPRWKDVPVAVGGPVDFAAPPPVPSKPKPGALKVINRMKKETK